MLPERDEFESITESAPLVAELRARIAADRPISFREFMQAALYHPAYGYYTTHAGAMSRGGDYLTSPEVHSIFGSMVAKQICELWQTMGTPPRFDIVEQGAGTGALARDMLRWAHAHAPEFALVLRYRIVEPLAAARTTQERTIGDLPYARDRIEWLDRLPTGVVGCIVTNELLDAFPVHRVVREANSLHEVFVAIGDDGRFVDHLGPAIASSPPASQPCSPLAMPDSTPSPTAEHADTGVAAAVPGGAGAIARPPATDAIARYFDAIALWPGAGCYAEVNLEAPRWIQNAAASLARGYVLTFDYGYEAADLYAPWRRDGTLLCFYQHSASSDPYQRIGKQDMTASIDFTTLRRAGEAAGLRTIGFRDQSTFLVRMGVADGIATVAASRPAEMEEYFARRGVVLALIDPARLGRIKVLLQAKAAPLDPPRGFRDKI